MCSLLASYRQPPCHRHGDTKLAGHRLRLDGTAALRKVDASMYARGPRQGRALKNSGGMVARCPKFGRSCPRGVAARWFYIEAWPRALYPRFLKYPRILVTFGSPRIHGKSQQHRSLGDAASNVGRGRGMQVTWRAGKGSKRGSKSRMPSVVQSLRNGTVRESSLPPIHHERGPIGPSKENEILENASANRVSPARLWSFYLRPGGKSLSAFVLAGVHQVAQ